jgi:cytochrome o ubiquinol oxidase operon protein cyoD
MLTRRSYIIGYVLSIALTLCAPLLYQWHVATSHQFPTHLELRVAFIALALVQLVVQLIFFLHLGDEKKPRWNLWAFGFAAIVVFILVGGTLWIMYNLSMGHMNTGEPYINGTINAQSEDD